MAANLKTPGKITIALASGSPITKSGDLIYVSFKQKIVRPSALNLGIVGVNFNGD